MFKRFSIRLISNPSGAKAALQAGDRVVATVRKNISELYASLDNHPNLLAVEMDVTKED
jgi:hypothetical protein